MSCLLDACHNWSLVAQAKLARSILVAAWQPGCTYCFCHGSLAICEFSTGKLSWTHHFNVDVV